MISNKLPYCDEAEKEMCSWGNS